MKPGLITQATTENLIIALNNQDLINEFFDCLGPDFLKRELQTTLRGDLTEAQLNEIEFNNRSFVIHKLARFLDALEVAN